MTYMLAEHDAELPFQLTSPILRIGWETTGWRPLEGTGPSP
jgi:hypothetical protein